MPSDHEDDEGPPGAPVGLNEEGNASTNDFEELLGAPGDVDSSLELVSWSSAELTAHLHVQGNEQASTNNRMDTNSSQLVGSPPARLHIDNDAISTTTERGNANDEHGSNIMRELSSKESSMKRPKASEASDCSIDDSSDDTLSQTGANLSRALNNPRTELPRVQVAGDEAASSTLQRAAVAGLKTTGLDLDEESDDEPRDRGPDAKTLQSAGLQTTGLDSDEESPDRAVIPDTHVCRNEQTNTTDNLSQLQPAGGSATFEEAAMSDALAFISSRTEHSSENSQEPNQSASLETGIREEQSGNLTRTSSLSTGLHNAAVPLGSPIGTAASPPIKEASNVSVQETSNNTSKGRSEQPRKQKQKIRSSNRPKRYKCGPCRCGRRLGHTGLCLFNTTKGARQEARGERVDKPIILPLPPDATLLKKFEAAGYSDRQEQDGKYDCGSCGRVPRPHACPAKRCPICGERRKDHNNSTFCPKKSKKSK